MDNERSLAKEITEGFEALKSMRNNELVAWYRKNSNDYLIENIGQPSFQVQEFIDAGYIPLYTHLNEHDLGIAEAIGFDKGYKAATVKELTQDEILDVWYAMKDDSNNWTRYVDFARAILRKAQEK